MHNGSFEPGEHNTFRVVLSSDDIPDGAPDSDIESIVDTIVETAGVLPNTRVDHDEYGHIIVTIARADDQLWGHIVERIRQLVTNYERLCRRRSQSRSASQQIDWTDYDDAVDDADDDDDIPQ